MQQLSVYKALENFVRVMVIFSLDTHFCGVPIQSFFSSIFPEHLLVYLILFSLNTFLQIHVHDLGSAFADLYTSLYIALDDVVSEEIYEFYLLKDSCAKTYSSGPTIVTRENC